VNVIRTPDGDVRTSSRKRFHCVVFFDTGPERVSSSDHKGLALARWREYARRHRTERVWLIDVSDQSVVRAPLRDVLPAWMAELEREAS
jgi:hypothetical protein